MKGEKERAGEGEKGWRPGGGGGKEGEEGKRGRGFDMYYSVGRQQCWEVF